MISTLLSKTTSEAPSLPDVVAEYGQALRACQKARGKLAALQKQALRNLHRPPEEKSSSGPGKEAQALTSRLRRRLKARRRAGAITEEEYNRELEEIADATEPPEDDPEHAEAAWGEAYQRHSERVEELRPKAKAALAEEALPLARRLKELLGEALQVQEELEAVREAGRRHCVELDALAAPPLAPGRVRRWIDNLEEHDQA